jgi:flavin reductase (DIM6/NTAB) family NADH-FMN oxidoreductase RutF
VEEQTFTRKIELDPIVRTLEMFPYGLYIIGSYGTDNVNGMMADWVMQVSFQPRLVAVSLENNSTTLRNLRENGVFTVNVLRDGDKALAAKFCQPHDASKIQGRSETASAVVYDKLRGVDYKAGQLTSCPVLLGALGCLECQVDQFFEAGDHTLAVGRVLAGEVLNEGEPLSSHSLGWSYAG